MWNDAHPNQEHVPAPLQPVRTEENTEESIELMHKLKGVLPLILELSPPKKTKKNLLCLVFTATSSGAPIPSIPSTSSSDCDDGTFSSSKRDFTIPTKWKPSIMFAISEKKLNPEVRNEIVRDLITHMYGFVDKPSPKVARMLVEKYPFMADSVTLSGSTVHVNY